jgi:hypothetical protein
MMRIISHLLSRSNASLKNYSTLRLTLCLA